MTCRVTVYLLHESLVNAIVFPVMLQFPRDKGKKYFQIFHFIYVTQGFLKTFDDIEL